MPEDFRRFFNDFILFGKAKSNDPVFLRCFIESAQRYRRYFMRNGQPLGKFHVV